MGYVDWHHRHKGPSRHKNPLGATSGRHEAVWVGAPAGGSPCKQKCIHAVPKMRLRGAGRRRPILAVRAVRVSGM